MTSRHRFFSSFDLVQLDGKIIAPSSSGGWGSGLLQWIEFKDLKGITIKGKGIIDGQGSVWWKDNNPVEESDENNSAEDLVINLYLYRVSNLLHV